LALNETPHFCAAFSFAGVSLEEFLLDVAVEDSSFAISRKAVLDALQESILKDWLR
jgi:hypothetical protein